MAPDYSVRQEEIDRVVARIRPQAAAIREAAAEGDQLAKSIMTLYGFLAKRVEHASLALLNSSLDDWERRGQDGQT